MKNKIFRSHDSSQNQKFQLFQHEKVSSTGDIFSQNLHQDDRTTTNQSEQKPTMAELFEELGVTFFIDDAEVSHSQQESSPPSQANPSPIQNQECNRTTYTNAPDSYQNNHTVEPTQSENTSAAGLASPHRDTLSDSPSASLLHTTEPFSAPAAFPRLENTAAGLVSPHKAALSDSPSASLLHTSEPFSAPAASSPLENTSATGLVSPHKAALSDSPSASLLHTSEPFSAPAASSRPESTAAAGLVSPHKAALSDSPSASLLHTSESVSAPAAFSKSENIFASNLKSSHEAMQSDNPLSSLVYTEEDVFHPNVSVQPENTFASSLISTHKTEKSVSSSSSVLHASEKPFSSDLNSEPENVFASSLLSSENKSSEEQLKSDTFSQKENIFASNLLDADSNQSMHSASSKDAESEHISVHPKENSSRSLLLNTKKHTANNPKTPADSIAPSRTDIYADSLSSSSPKKSRLKETLYHTAIHHGGGASEGYVDRASAAERRAIVTGAAMTYSASKKIAKATYRQGKFAFLSHKDWKDGMFADKKSVLLKNGKFAAKQGKGLLKDAGKRLAHEGLLVAEDIEGSEDLGMQAMVKTKNVVRDTSRMVSGAKRLFGKNKPQRSFLQVLRQTPSAVSKVVANTGRTFSKVITGVSRMSRSFGIIAIISLFLVVTLLAMPVAYAVVGAASLASDDETLTEVYTYITELDAKLSKKINGYSSKADVVSYTYNGSETIDPITITTNPDPILNYLDCVYGDYKFSDVKSAIDDIYSAVYKVDVSEYVQDVPGTSEADKTTTTETVVDKDGNQDGTSTDEKKDSTDLILTYTPTYGGIVSKKSGSTLTTAILNNSKCLGNFKLTFYCGCPICSEQWGTQTATGVTATEGRTIAVDPKVIPYGTKVHIDGFGDFIAEDCGGAIKGNRIDIFVSDHQRCNNLGVQYAAVYAMNSNVTGGIYIPGISKNEVKHMDVNVTSETLVTYLQNQMNQDQKDKSDLMNQLGQYTTHMNYGSPLESNSWSIARRYGYQYSSGSISQHFGIDITVSSGQKLLAVTSGKITEIGTDDEHGSYLVLEKGKNKFLYGGLGTISVKKGDTVQRGDVIAKSGRAPAACETNTVHMEYTHDGKSLNPSFYLYNELASSNATGTGSTDIVEVARSQLGQRGGEPYWSYMGFHSRVAWCASFVSWCANQCGYIDAGIIPKFAACQAQGIPWFQQHGLWQDRSYTPAPGDIIFFDWEGDGHSDHVGIVEKVENSMVYTIEGNSNDAVNERKYTLGSSQICGYGVPQYPKGDKS